MNSPQRVTIVEVGPRDGFQMEKAFLPTELKVEVINILAGAGIPKIEATSFVRPDIIPQMADAREVMSRITRRQWTRYTVLVPNVKGAELAVRAGVDGLRLVVCTTETYNRRNVGMSVDESLALLPLIQAVAKPSEIQVEVVISLAFGCPYEGDVPEEKVVELAKRVYSMGVEEISIADSIGTANPAQVQRLVQRLRAELPDAHFSLHIHNTRGLGLANVLAALQVGIDTFDSSLGGLGGCPVFSGASGNVPTEDLVNLCEEMGIETGVDLSLVREASRKVQDFLGRALPSHILAVGTRAELFKKAKSATDSFAEYPRRQ